MAHTNTRQGTAIGLGLCCSLLYSILLSNIPLVQTLELKIQDALVQQRGSRVPPREILLVNIDRKSSIKFGELSEGNRAGAIYSQLTRRLLKAGAKVVLLNLPDSLKLSNSNSGNPMMQVVKDYDDRIVFITHPRWVPSKKYPVLPIYNHLLPVDNSTFTPYVSSEEVQGFFESDLGSEKSMSLTSPARQTNLFGTFIQADSGEVQEFKSAAVLAFEKFSKFSQLEAEPSTLQTTVQINFWGPTGTFPRIPIESLCLPNVSYGCIGTPGSPQLQQVRNRIVLIGFTEEGSPESAEMKSPFYDDLMPGVEVQANLLAGLLTDSLYQPTPQWLQVGIIVSGAVLLSRLLAFVMTPQGLYKPWGILIGFGIVGGYSSLSLLAFWHGLIFPIALPVIAWIVTGVSVTIYLRALQRRQWIAQQLFQLEQLKLAERQAVLSRTRKLLTRIATDIHDGPLQELRLAMDRIEILQLDHPTLESTPILNKLVHVGQGVRDQLNNVLTIANKLDVTPELRKGLAAGIRKDLQQLRDSGKLRLLVNLDNLHEIGEPYLSSTWIDAREDIFRFFRETINNVIHHAQPPYGSATRVLVSLRQKETECTLIIENDGLKSVRCELDNSVTKQNQNGYGTKIIDTIAAGLPDGSWERVALVNGGMSIKLTWSLKFDT